MANSISASLSPSLTSNITCEEHCVHTSDYDKEYLYVVMTAVMSGLSIFGGTSICILYIVFKDLRTPGRTLLFFLAFSDALLALGNLLGIIWFLYSNSAFINKSEGYCDFQSAMTIYFSITSFSWTVIMGVSLFSTVVLNNQTFTSTYMKLFHIIAWIPGGIITIVAWSLGVLGTDTTLDQASWCWIDPRVPYALFWQFATGKFFEILCYIATVVLYSAIKIFLARQSNKMIGKAKKKSKKDVIADANRKLTFVPLVFIVCRIWGTLRFLIGNFGLDIVNEPYVTWINPLQGIGDSAQGFANFVIYCFSTESIRQRMFPCARNKIHIAVTSGIESKTKELRSTHKTSVTAVTDQGIKNGLKTTEVSTGVSFGVAKSSTCDESNPLNTTNTTIIDGPEHSASKYVVSDKSQVELDEEIEVVKKQHVSIVTKVDNRNSGIETRKCVDHNSAVVSYTNEHSKEEKVDKLKIPIRRFDHANINSEEENKKAIDHGNISNINKTVNYSDTSNESEDKNSEVISIAEINKTHSAVIRDAIIDINEPSILTDTGGVYLGTKESDPSRMIECTVQLTPQQDSKNDDELQTSKTTQNTNIDSIRGLSVTVNIHDTSEHGLPEISD